MTLVIDPAHRDDEAAVAQLLKTLWPQKHSDAWALQQAYLQALASKHQYYFCARYHDEVVGFVSLSIKTSLWQEGLIAHVDELVVAPIHRGQGIGTQLMRAAMTKARQLPCVGVELDSAYGRQAAHRFYEQLGFKNRAAVFSLLFE